MTSQTALTRQASPRLVAVAALAVGGMFGGLLAGRPELVAISSPFALMLVAGLVLAERPGVRATLTPGSDRIVAGDEVEAMLVIDTTVPARRLAVRLARRGVGELVEPADGALCWVVSGTREPCRMAIRVHTRRWGVEAFGPLDVEVSGPFGLVRWSGRLPIGVAVRVLPDDGTLGALLPNLEPRAASGAHIAPRRGEGFEFAEVRQYRHGDRLRSVNWYQSARRNELWVNEHHPERSGDLVVLVDTFADRRTGGSESLETTVRIAWQVATAHLGAHDRVGVVGFGGLPSWVLPTSGARARLAVLDRLLDVHATWSEAQRSVAFLPRQVFPAGSQVIAVTGLHDERMIAGIGELVRRGHDVSVVVVDVPDPQRTDAEVVVLARRLWKLELRERRRSLERLGIPIVSVTHADPSAVLALARVRRRPTRRTS